MNRLASLNITPGSQSPCCCRALIDYAISSSPLLTGLQPAVRQAVAELAVLRQLRAGEHLFYQATPSSGFYLIHSGLIRLYRVNGRGQEQLIHLARSPESVAEESLFGEQGYLSHAQASKPSTLVFFPRAGFLAQLALFPELGSRLLQALSLHFADLVTLLDDLRLKDSRTRLLRWILSRCPDPESEWRQDVQIPVSKGLLAAELGMTSETLSRLLADLQRRDLLQVHRRTLRVRSALDLQRATSGSSLSTV